MKTTTKANEKIRKLFNITVKSIDEENRKATFVFSDNSVDRYGEKVDQSWDIKNYEKNPVILWGHDPSKAENVIGSASEMTLNENGKSLLTAQFDDDPHAQLIFNKIKKGILRTVSAGFIPHTLEFEDDVPVLKDNELLEVSVVAIPANPNAVALDYKSGGMSRKDADFLIKSMREEADAIEAEVTKNTEGEEEEDAVATLTAAVEALTATVTALSDEVTALKDTQQTEETEEEDDSAKGGDDDQSGADEDIDLDTELTDEQLAQLEQELAETTTTE